METDIVVEREEIVQGFLVEVSKLEDPRMDRCKRHSFGEIFLLVLCAQINFEETMREYEMYGRFKINLLRHFLPYKYGSPSRSTIARVFALFNPEKLSELFVSWMQQIVGKARREQENKEPDALKSIAIDGKRNRGLQNDTLHTVSAFDTKTGFVIGEEKVADGSNEITAIPALIDKIDIAGHLVSIDAIGTHKEIAEQIHSKGADYMLALKKNQKNLYEAAHDYFMDEELLKNCSVTQRSDKGHGRIEKRTCYATDDIEWLEKKGDWKGLQSIAMVIAERTVKGKKSTEKRFYITSIKPDSEKILAASRAHWNIENALHWVLDVIFGEDKRILWNKNIAHNESIIRKIALNLVKLYRSIFPPTAHKKEKIAIKSLRKFISYDDTFMIQLLQGIL